MGNHSLRPGAPESMPTHAGETSGAAAPDYADGLKPRDPLFTLARRILQCERDALQASLRPARALPLPEEIHAARIAVRRIRVALRVFRDFMPVEVEGFRTEFRWLGQGLGEVRDLDVYEASLRGEGDAKQALPAALERKLAKTRKEVSARLVALLGSKRFADLLSSFSDFVDSDLPASVQRRWRSLRIRDAIQGDVRQSLKRVLKLGRKIDAGSPPDVLHKLRIRAKRLRYETEFYLGFYPDLRDLTRRAKDLQDVLGAERDASNAAERLSEFAGKARGVTAKAGAAPLIQIQNELAAARRQQLSAAWRRFEKTAAKTRLNGKRP
jgi:CHAD domain-containing protein